MDLLPPPDRGAGVGGSECNAMGTKTGGRDRTATTRCSLCSGHKLPNKTGVERVVGPPPLRGGFRRRGEETEEEEEEEEEADTVDDEDAELDREREGRRRCRLSRRLAPGTRCLNTLGRFRSAVRFNDAQKARLIRCQGE